MADIAIMEENMTAVKYMDGTVVRVGHLVCHLMDARRLVSFPFHNTADDTTPPSSFIPANGTSSFPYHMWNPKHLGLHTLGSKQQHIICTLAWYKCCGNIKK